MRVIKNTTEGEIYRVIDEEKKQDFVGILINKSQHLGKDDICITFYTIDNIVEEIYEKEANFFKDNTIDKKVTDFLKLYYEEYKKAEEITNQITKLHIERGKIWEKQEKITQELINLTGSNKKTEIHDFYEVADTKEDSQIQILAETVTETVKETYTTIKTRKSCQAIKDRLSIGFDRMWDYIDQKKYN